MKRWERFFKIAKVDKDAQMVYGYASTDDLDSDGEIIKVSALEKALPGYLKFPTIREMHQAKAIGTTKEATVDKKGLYIGAKVVDKGAWELVKEGVYTAFSIGGDVVKRVGNVIQELDLIEISLVDVPANKAAVIEVWKRGKLTKDAETAYSMANLMIQVKDKISYYEYLGKDTKKLKRILEMVKEVLVVEASEPESYDNGKDGVPGLWGGTPAEIEKKILILEKMDLSKDPYSDLIRKGVILNMAKKIEKKDPKEEEEVEETQTETEETETEEKAEEAETTEDEKSEDAEAETEDSEKGEVDVAMEKVSQASKKLDKISEKKAEKSVDSKNIAKAVSSMAESLVKMTDVIVGLEERLATVEKSPAAVKSKSAVVMKKIDSGSEGETEEKVESGELAVKKARIAELNKKFDELGKAQFAKQGFSAEAARLLAEIEKLEQNQA